MFLAYTSDDSKDGEFIRTWPFAVKDDSLPAPQDCFTYMASNPKVHNPGEAVIPRRSCFPLISSEYPSFRKALPAQPLDATLSNQLDRQCFSTDTGSLGLEIIQT